MYDRLEKYTYHEPNTGCWLWGAALRNGYGILKVERKMKLVHRLRFEQFKGPIPKGLFVCHHCDVPLCSNPDHLFLGGPKENYEDARKKNRAAVGSRQGSAKLTANDVTIIREAYKNGYRQCDIAKYYKLNYHHVKEIVHNKVWTHLN